MDVNTAMQQIYSGITNTCCFSVENVEHNLRQQVLSDSSADVKSKVMSEIVFLRSLLSPMFERSYSGLI